ncbi:hypothetical protein OS127_02820 [Corynebacterium sp. P6129]|uniref:hypothetical protein n=1 Tax=Corynebacterium antarcticum TaxID=2800405 RepID=UPI002260ADD6|nr:hypothetical protein [Corynebacterium antarcticum]MCX7491462.1 hypothetical protein [Corynebacterium antarcticum]
MPRITGNLRVVTGAPHLVREVWIRANEPREGAGGVVTDANTRVDVGEDGSFTVDVDPGAATLVLLQRTPGVDHVTLTSIPLMVTSGSSTLAEVVTAASIVGSDSAERIGRLLAAALTEVQGRAGDLDAEIAALRETVAGVSQQAGAAGEELDQKVTELQGKVTAGLRAIAAAESRVGDKVGEMEQVRQQAADLVQQARQQIEAGLADGVVAVRHLAEDVTALIAGKADAAHRHPLSDVDGIPSGVTTATVTPDADTLAVRGAAGTVKVGDATEQDQAVNLKVLGERLAEAGSISSDELEQYVPKSLLSDQADAARGTVVARDDDGSVAVPSDPKTPTSAVNSTWVKKEIRATNFKDMAGIPSPVEGMSYYNVGETVVVRHGDGHIVIGDPSADDHAATKGYTDGKVAGLASTEYVNGKVAGLATQSYVDTELGKKASTSYVDSKVSQATADHKPIKVVDRADQATESGVVYLVKGS